MTKENEKKRGGNWMSYRERTCYSLHECALCGSLIRLGERYKDGGYGRRAHDDCVKGLTAAATLREAERRSRR